MTENLIDDNTPAPTNPIYRAEKSVACCPGCGSTLELRYGRDLMRSTPKVTVYRETPHMVACTKCPWAKSLQEAEPKRN